MNIFLTFDYELFFGKDSGSVEKCMIEPTNELLKIAKEYDIRLTFFVDVGYLIRLKEFVNESPDLLADYQNVIDQIQEIVRHKHDIQLHIHPHWEKSYYANGKWTIVTTDCYKLSDFPDNEIKRIVRTYKSFLDDLIGYKTTAFRAGGWCIQPFDRLKDVFEELGLKYDSSVFPGGKFISPEYSFDFTNAPKKSHYRFNIDVCVEDKNGYFTEYPISSMKYSPFFYWKLYILGRLKPEDHKMVGDGLFLDQPGRKKSVLTRFTWNHVSCDGYYSNKLFEALFHLSKKQKKDMVIIGHPKGMTRYSFKTLECFIKFAKNNHSFSTFREL